jgi:anti-sigma factor RsiW
MQQPMEFVNHISDHDLERYYLGMVKDEAELASLEEHLLACPACVERAESTQDYVDALRAALVTIRED